MTDRPRRRFRAGLSRIFSAILIVFGFACVARAGIQATKCQNELHHSAGSLSAGLPSTAAQSHAQQTDFAIMVDRGFGLAVIAAQAPAQQANPEKSAHPDKPADPPSVPKDSPSTSKKKPDPKRKEADSRQVTLFGIIATPNDTTIDPKLIDIEPQLRKLFPHYGFRMIHARGKRLAEGETLECDLEDGYIAETRLNKAIDENGRVELRVVLTLEGEGQIATDVITPPNQLFFCDKRLSDGMTRLLIGVGAR